jgi:uncharacterized repeat protein (TIGR01451 family)
MRFIIQRWRHSCLLLFMLLPGIFVLEASPVAADEISNTAVFGGDNLDRVTSNTAVFTVETAALQITKTADRAAAEPGDTVIYRVSIRNIGNAIANNLTLTDTLPLGLQFAGRSLQASVINGTSNTPVTVSSSQGERTVTINYAGRLRPKETLNVVYATTVTPDGVRGTGRNLAIANSGNIRSNTASHLLKIRPGILSNCATLIGRVFVDKNFDGEQQTGEPGIPNAVIYMDDGNRILTDANGMFSLTNVISGNRTGTLDISSLPGYIQAPNLYNIKQNSQSRLVRLAPGGMGRMNFAVTPAFGEGRQ